MININLSITATELPEVLNTLARYGLVKPPEHVAEDFITKPSPTLAPIAAPAHTPVPIAEPTPAPQSYPQQDYGQPAPSYPPAPVAVPTVAPAPITLDQLCVAGASLVDAHKQAELVALLAKYRVQALPQLKPEDYGAFATDLRQLGAQI